MLSDEQLERYANMTKVGQFVIIIEDMESMARELLAARKVVEVAINAVDAGAIDEIHLSLVREALTALDKATK